MIRGETMDNKKIGEFIKSKRKEKKLTQQSLGNLVGVSFKAVSNWECGNAMPDISILKKICEILEITTDELLDGKDNIESPNKKDNPKFKNYIIRILILLSILSIIIITTIKIYKSNNKEITKDYECTLIKTYNVNNINPSNDEFYLYITFTEYQTEGVYTIKLPKTITKNLEKNENYEFTFKTNKEYVSKTPDIIFSNSELINIEHTDNTGLNQINKFYCN